MGAPSGSGGGATSATDSLAGRQYLVTNAATGAGLQAARELVHRGAHVVITAPSAEVAAAAAAQLRGEAQGANAGLVEGMALDPYDLDSVRAFVRSFKMPGRRRALHALVHAPVEHEAGMGHDALPFPVGADRELVANHLSPFLLTQLLLPMLIHSAPSRIVLCPGAAHASGDAARLRSLCEQGEVRRTRLTAADVAIVVFVGQLVGTRRVFVLV